MPNLNLQGEDIPLRSTKSIMMRAAAAFVAIQVQPRENKDDGTTSAAKEQPMSGGLSLVATVVLVVLFSISKTPLPVASSSQSTADLP